MLKLGANVIVTSRSPATIKGVSEVITGSRIFFTISCLQYLLREKNTSI